MPYLRIEFPNEVDAALGVLVGLSKRDAVALNQFAPFLTGILDYLCTLSVPQARLAFELFARLAYHPQLHATSRLADELMILLRKQLSSASARYK